MADENKTPEADRYDSTSNLVSWIHDQMKESKSATSTWRKDMSEDFAFYACDQWSSEDAAKLEEEGRPAVAFNRFARTINAVCGLEVQNRQDVTYLPRETTDTRLADYFKACVDWDRDQVDAEDEDSEAFQDTVICGMGWTQTRPDYDKDPDGIIDVSRFDPGEAFWDRVSRKRNLTDTRWRARVKRYGSTDDVKAAFPQFKEVIDQSGEGGPRYLERTEAPSSGGDSLPLNNYDKPGGGAAENIEVVCFNWYDSEPFYRVVVGDNVTAPQKMIKLSETKFTALRDKLDQMGVKYLKQRKRVYRHAYVCGNQLLLETADQEDLEGETLKSKLQAPTQKGFVFNCITGLRNRNDNTWFGLGRLMVDPQRWANKWLSQTMHIMNSNSKGGLLAEKDAFENVRKAEEAWSDQSKIVWLKPGALAQGKVKERGFSQFPAGFHQLMAYAVESINETPGVSTEMMGNAERDQPAVLEETRKRAGITMLGVLFASLRLYRKEQGRVLADMVAMYLSDGRKLRIIGSDGQPQVAAMMREPMGFSYDIVVADSPNSPSMKDKNFAIMRELLPVLAQGGVPFIPELLDHTPLPADLIEKWKKAMPKPGEPKPPPPEVIKAQMEMQIKQQQAQFDQQAKMADHQAGLAAQREQMQLEREQAAFQAQLEREKAGLQAQLEQEKTRQAIAIEWEKAKADAEIEAFKAQKKADLDARVAAADAAVQAKLAEASARDERVISNTDSAMKVSQGIGDHLSKLGDRLVDVAAMQQNLLHRRTRRVIKKDAQGNRYADEFPVDVQGNEILMH